MSKIKLQKGTLETIIVFILSPFLSVPFIFAQLKKGNDKIMTLLLSVIVGLLSFLFIPSSGFDKTVYIERYNTFLNYDFEQLKDYFLYGLKPDYIFDSIIYLFAQLNISFHYLFLCLTTLTVYSVFRFIKKTNEKVTQQPFYYNIIFALFVLFSFSLPGLFSGIRFIFAGSIFIWAIYYLSIDRVWSKGVFYFAAAILTHFSFAFFIPSIILLIFWPKRINPKLLLLFSLVFLLLPMNFLQNIFESAELFESYSNKADAYLTMERETTINAQVLTYLRNLWVYFSYIYILFINKEKNNKILFIFIVLLSFINLTYSVPIVFDRYLVVLKLLFASYLINSKNNGSIKNIYFYIYFALACLSIFIDLYVLRPSIFASYSVSNMLTIAQVLSSKFNVVDILNY